ncbi:MAG: hypothetical protein PHE79_11525 [Eubacteriales bacterium]|nr:hypothetical protein [Eubacteriales bacterium]
MFNTFTGGNTNTNTNVKINAVSGLILKNHTKSYFRRFHLQSAVANSLFVPDGSIIVLQMLICGDMEVIAELVKREDFEEASTT